VAGGQQRVNDALKEADAVIRAERLDKSYAVRDNINTRYASSRSESYGEEWILIWRPRPMLSTSRSF